LDSPAATIEAAINKPAKLEKTFRMDSYLPGPDIFSQRDRPMQGKSWKTERVLLMTSDVA
jgi:hypothetical protein